MRNTNLQNIADLHLNRSKSFSCYCSSTVSDDKNRFTDHADG
jgi:hypothetical protein